MEKLFESWKKRKLTIFGECEIINTLAISKLINIATVLPIPDEYTIKCINKLIYNFLWNSRGRIKRNTVISPINRGGINLVDIETKFKDFKVSWIPRLSKDTENVCMLFNSILKINGCTFSYLHPKPILKNFGTS